MSDKDMLNNSVFKYDEQAQESWLESLSETEFKDWLENFIWLDEHFPLNFSHSTALSSISNLLQNGSSELQNRSRKLLPDILRTWGRGATSLQLETILVLCGRLRCVEAETAIIQILNERLKHLGNPEYLYSKQNLLSTLSGFGCTKYTRHIFEEYIVDINFAPICYNALYRYNIFYAATYLPFLVDLYSSSHKLDDLRDLIEYLFAITLKNEIVIAEFWTNFFQTVNPKELISILNNLASIGITVEPFSSYSDNSINDSPENLFINYDRTKDWSFEGNKIMIAPTTNEGKKTLSIINNWQEQMSPLYLNRISARARTIY